MAQRTGKPVETVLDELIDTLPEEPREFDLTAYRVFSKEKRSRILREQAE